MPRLHLFVCVNERDPNDPLGPGCRGNETYAALKDPTLAGDPNFKTFLDIFANKYSAFDPPITTIGTYPIDQQSSFITKWESGKVPNLHAGLQDLATQIDKQLTLGA